MSITPQERELVTIGIAVACGCQTSLRGNMLAAHRLHVADKDIADAVSIAINTRRSATDNIEKFVALDFTEISEPEQNLAQQDNQRVEMLVSVGTAFAVNCASSLRKHVATAEAIGIEAEDLNEVIRLSEFMKTVAASHVEQVMCPDEFDDATNTLAEYSTPFGPEHCAWAGLCKPTTQT